MTKKNRLALFIFTNLLLVVLVAQTCEAQWGDLTAQFIFDGKAAAPKRLPITKDNECCDQYAAEIVEQSLLIGEKNALTNVYLWMRVGRRDPKPAIHPDYEAPENMTVQVDNTHCMFYPHAVALWAPKQKLVIKNFDPIAQAAQITSLTGANPALNATLPIDGVIEHKFNSGEPVPLTILCGMHPWETGKILVHDNPYFGISGKDGSLKIENIPVGEWEFQLWHEKAGYLEAKREWRRGRFKLKIEPGENDLGVLKITPAMID